MRPRRSICIIVLKGEIPEIVDQGEKLLKQGDGLIEHGTNHSWSVRTKEPCAIAAVLIGAKPAGRLAKLAKRARAEMQTL